MTVPYTLWTAVVTGNGTIAGTLAAILLWINTAQNTRLPAGKAQKSYGLTPDGTLYQRFYVSVINPEKGITEDIVGLDDLGVLFSDNAARALTLTPGKIYVTDMRNLVNQSALDTAIAGVVVSPSDVAAQLAVRDDIQAIVSAETAKAVSASVDADQIRAEAIQAALERVNTSQVFSDVSTRIYNALAEDSDDIITSANINLFRGIIAEFETKLSAMQTRITTIESGAG